MQPMHTSVYTPMYAILDNVHTLTCTLACTLARI